MGSLSSAIPAGATTERRFRWARVYRDGRLVCGRADVVVGRDLRRVGLTPPERRYVKVRFLERVAPELCDELVALRQRRGARGQRLAERIEPITLVVQDERGRLEINVEIEPPQLNHRAEPLRDVEFRVREVDRRLN